MNPRTLREAKGLFAATREAAQYSRDLSIIVAPPTIFLYELAHAYKGKRLVFAAQDMHFENEGAHTGDTSPAQLKDAKVSCVVIGHAERRAAGETNDGTRKKMAAAFAAKIMPILCVGETSRDGNGGHFDFIKEQLRVALADISPAQIARVVIAYEPVWAIGATEAMSPAQMHEMAIFIRKSIVATHGEKGMKAKILYGGSIDEKNARAMLEHGDVEGLLVGRASADAVKFSSLINSLS